MNVYYWLGLSILSAICYRLGGMGGFKGAKLIRRLGCALIALWLWFILYAFEISYIWAYGAFVGLNYLALSTYHDYLGEDNFWVTGLGYSLAALPLAYISGHWIGYFARCIVCILLIGYWSKKTSNSTIEELGRGFIYTASLPMLSGI